LWKKTSNFRNMFSVLGASAIPLFAPPLPVLALMLLGYVALT